MNNIEKNALKIAELVGYKLTAETYTFEGRWYYECEIRESFSSYNGLMPIVFEIYASKNFTINIYKWAGRCILLTYNDKDDTNWGHEPIVGNYRYDFGNGKITEPEFIEAIQSAVIKYLELKNGK